MHEITVRSGYDNSRITIEFKDDANNDDMITIFKTIAKFLTFNDSFLEYKD